MQRLFCSTIYVFNPTGTHTLLIDHKKLKRWVPPGGKVDPHETPDEAAVRESLEETGLHVTLLGYRPPVEGGLITPQAVQLNEVIKGERDHIDLIYLAIADDSKVLTLSEREAGGIRWFKPSEVMEPSFNTFDTVRYWVDLFAQEIKKYIKK